MAGKQTLKKLLKLYALYGRMDLEWFLRNAGMALLAIVADIFGVFSGLSGVFLLAWQFDGLGGLSRQEVMFMLSYLLTVTGTFQLFFASNNVGYLSRRIGRGQIDHMMVQPVPFWMQLLAEGFMPVTGSENLIAGIAFSLYTISHLQITLTPLWFGFYILSIITSVITMLGLSYLFSAFAFWKPVACEEISSTVLGDVTGMLANYPLAFLPRKLQWALITALPAGVIGWFPASALLYKAPLGLPSIYPMLLAAVIWGTALFLLRKGFRYYVQYGSNRYSAGGFRN